MRRRFRAFLAIAGAVLACVPVQSAPRAGDIEWLPVVNLASGGGMKGPWRQNDSHYDYVDDGSLAFTHGGDLALAWVDQRRKEVLLQVLGPDGRPRMAPSEVSRSPATFSWMPRIAAGGPNTLYLLWQEIIFSGGSHGGDILFARSTDGGRSFSAPVNLSNSRGGDGKGRLDRDTWSNGSLDIAAGADGSLLAAWTEYDGALWLARSRDGGRSFGKAQRIAGDDGRPARGPALAVGAAGRVYLAWTVGADPDADIRVSLSLDGGARFAAPVQVGAAGARADAPRLALDRQGRLHLAYMEETRGDAPVIRYATAAGPVLAFSRPRTLSRKGAAAPQLAIDAGDRVHIVWEAAARGTQRPRGLVHTMDAGAGFTRPALIAGSVDGAGGSNGSQQGLLGKKLAAGPGGVIAVVNSSLAPGRGSRVWLMRGSLDGPPE